MEQLELLIESDDDNSYNIKVRTDWLIFLCNTKTGFEGTGEGVMERLSFIDKTVKYLDLNIERIKAMKDVLRNQKNEIHKKLLEDI